MIFTDHDGLPYADTDGALVRVSECHEAPLTAEPPLDAVTAFVRDHVRLLAVCSVCGCYVENAAGDHFPLDEAHPNITDREHADSVREALR